ncbi:glycosyltransferase family 2 protein [Roseitranquillus sediminis]|uniref:glycosyltransferase family 2 protein n=1 Tax=Roseitranquillus sediminis TaxID=2809051 RepID=UPI001D0C8E13|nr:glycosyltransferase family A protein [Roseitranquillus sediminis]MBM9593890.1 glycosyltransferase family 2 protein [Roseitranquillus sediminis]
MSVSVVIPCRDGAAFLAQTIRSVLNQTAPPDEVLVIDDGSTDASPDIARSFGGPVAVHAGPARGASAARVRGAALVRGQRLMFMDADDLLTPGTLAALSAALDAGRAPGLAIGPWDRYERVGPAWLARPPSIPHRRPGQDDLSAWMTGRYSPPCAVLWDRAAYDASGGWDAESRGDDDGNLMRRAMARGVPIRRTRDGLSLYRRLPGEALSLSGRRFSETGLRSRLRALENTRDELVRAGRLDRYRVELSDMARALRRDAREHPDIAAAAEALILSPPARRGRLAAAGARLRAELDHRFGPVARPARVAAAVEAPPVTEGPQVSVVLPAEPGIDLAPAIASVLGQSYGALELMVVGETDPAGLADDARLRLVPAAGGLAEALNAGLEAAQGAYVAFLDPRDVWQPDKLARQVGLLEAAAHRVGVCSTGAESDAEGQLPARGQGDFFAALLWRETLRAPGSTVLVRRQVVEAVGGFDPTLPALAIWEWLQRAARLYHFASVNAPLVRLGPRPIPDPAAERAARAALWERNRHALRRAGVAHAYLLDSARQTASCGDRADAARLALRAMAQRPLAQTRTRPRPDSGRDGRHPRGEYSAR